MTGLRGILRMIRNRLTPAYGSPQRYWSRRYQRFSSSAVGPGCIDLDREQNEVDYRMKRDRIGAAVSSLGPPRGRTLLDAGCGAGMITGCFVELGYEVTGIDFAPNAVELARARHGNGVRWHTSALHEFDPGRRFDVVACIDVLLHITDDSIFEATLVRLASLVADGGALVVQDHLVEPSQVARKVAASESHVRWRSIEEYRRALEPEWSLVGRDRYELAGERATMDILIFRRR